MLHKSTNYSQWPSAFGLLADFGKLRLPRVSSARSLRVQIGDQSPQSQVFILQQV
jgi:hypothetical protein